MHTLLDYGPLIGSLASVLMLAVWAFYLHLFWWNFRWQHRASIVISRGAGAGLDSLCIVSNMSAKPIFIEGIIVFAEKDGRRWASAVMNLADVAEDAMHGLKPVREGPLKSGEYITVGRFRDLVNLANAHEPHESEIECIEVWIVADFSSENDLVFSRRQFLLANRGERIVFRPAKPETRRITKARERREVEELLQRYLEEAAGRG